MTIESVLLAVVGAVAILSGGAPHLRSNSDVAVERPYLFLASTLNP
jgi:hypothetical protein